MIYQKQNIAILGGGISGAGAAVLAKKQGYQVFVSDFGAIPQKYKNLLIDYQIDFEEHKHSESRILSANTIIKSPGIPNSTSIMRKVMEIGIPVISEIEFAGLHTTAKKKFASQEAMEKPPQPCSYTTY